MDISSSGLRDLKNVIPNCHFDMPKPVSLIKRIIALVMDNNSSEIMLDFFAGSGSSGQAIMEVNKEDCGNRKFILVQSPEKIKEQSSENFITISQLTYQRVFTFARKNQLDCNIKFLKYYIPKVINSSSAAGGAGVLRLQILPL